MPGGRGRAICVRAGVSHSIGAVATGGRTCARRLRPANRKQRAARSRPGALHGNGAVVAGGIVPAAASRATHGGGSAALDRVDQKPSLVVAALSAAAAFPDRRDAGAPS